MNIDLTLKNNLLVWLLAILGSFVLAGAIVTGSKFFLAPLLIICLWLWIQFATKYPAAALIIIVFFAEDCFDMITFGLRQRLLSDIGIAFMLPLLVINFRRIWNHIASTSPYAIAILLFFFALLTSLYFGSHIKMGQPMVVGLTVARKYLFFFSYFFLVAVNATEEDCYRFIKYIAWLGAIIAFLFIIEVALGGGTIFPHIHDVGGERAGRLRIHTGTFLIVFSVVYSFIKYPYLPELSQQRTRHLLIISLGLTALLSIVMTRAMILGLLVTFIFWLIRSVTNRKIMFVSIIISISIVAFFLGFWEIILTETFIGGIIEKTSFELSSSTGNIFVRLEGIRYFFDVLLQNAPITGIGLFSSTNYPGNPITIAGDLYNYYVADINGFGTIIYFGLQGVFLLSFFVIKSLRDCISAMNHSEMNKRYYFEILYFIFIYTLATPSLNNIIAQRMLVYSGVFFYLLTLHDRKHLIKENNY